MAKLNEESIKALSKLQELEIKEIVKVMNKLEKLGLGHHADHVISSLAGCGASLNKI